MNRSFFARFALPIMMVMAFLSSLIFTGALRALATNHNDVKEWLPASYQETKDLDWFVKHFAGQLFVMISWDGCTVDDTRLDTFVKKLKDAHPDGHKLFSDVITGKHLVQRLQAEPINLSEEEAYRRLSGLLIGPDKKQTCAIITLSEDARALLNDTKAKVKPIAEIQRIATEECAVPAESIRMGGPPVDNVALDAAGQSSMLKLAAAAAVIGIVVSWWCLRSVRLVFMVFMAGLLSAAASLAIIWYIRPLFPSVSMNAILLTMPSLVYVAGISAAIHLANFYRETVHEEGPDGAPTRALLHAKLPLSLATGTTACGLATLAYSDLVPIQHFGIFSALGVIASTLIIVFYVPSVLELFPLIPKSGPKEKIDELDAVKLPVSADRWQAAGHWIISHPYLASLSSLAVMGICALGFSRVETSVNLMRLFPPDNKIIHDYTWLEQKLGPLIPMEVVLRVPKDTKLDAVGRMQLIDLIQRRIEKIEVVGNAMSAVTFAPELGPRAESAKEILAAANAKFGIRDQKMIRRKATSKRLEANRQQFIDNDYLDEEGENTDLWRISARVAALEDVDYGLFVGDLKNEVEPILAEYNQLVGATKPEEKVSAVYTGLVPLVYKAQRSLLEGLIFGFVTDVLLVVVVIMLVVREWSAGVILFFPAIVPCVVVFGLMGWFGVVIDIGTVMTPAVALGVTIDDVVHFMLRHRSALSEGATRRDAIMSAYKGCAQPMYQSWGVIGLGLSVFALSDFTPTQRFGVMMISMLTAALVGNLVLLPALLASPLGGLFGRRIVKKLARQKAEGQQPPVDGAATDGVAADGVGAGGKTIQGFRPGDTVPDPGKRVTTSPVASVHGAHGSIERHIRS